MDFNHMHKAHPWHGIDLGPNCPDEVRAFVEIVPTDTVKYEVDKASGYLCLDRPHRGSALRRGGVRPGAEQAHRRGRKVPHPGLILFLD